MFRMVEVIGTSEACFSEAAKDAVNKLVASGEKGSFFEVVEERGSIRNGKLKEFQVKLKVAVEFGKGKKSRGAKTEMDKACPTCLQPTGTVGHMCVPVTKEDEQCNWCGALVVDERHLCNEKVKELSYICNTCGCTAVSDEYLCEPRKIEGNK